MISEKRILVTGSGGAPSTNFVRSLRDSAEKFYLVGTDLKYYVHRSETDKTFIAPLSDERDYVERMGRLIEREKIEFLHCQPDREVTRVSRDRDKLSVRTFLPKHATVELCQNKFQSYRLWKEAGLKVPETTLISSAEDLRKAFDEFGDVWVRNITGAAGLGALPTTSFELAKAWIDYRDGWGKFTAARKLTKDSVTWLSLWKDGDLIVAQGRKRIEWEFANRSPAGVTGITGIAVTVADPVVDEISQKAILALDRKPHGIFGVDLTYDKEWFPNPTEINIGRFFTTHYFFTKAGLNMPYIYVKLGFDEPVELPEKRINPLPAGLYWIRGMDIEPKLVTQKEIDDFDRNRI